MSRWTIARTRPGANAVSGVRAGAPKPLPPVPQKPRMSAGRIRARRIRSLRAPLRLLALLAVAAAVVLAKDLLIPLVLAAFIALALNPIVAGLARIRIPRAIGALLVMLALIGVLGGTVNALSAPASHWLREAPVALREMGYRMRLLTAPLNRVSHAASVSLAGIGLRSAQPSVKVAAPGGFSFNDVVHAAPRILTAVLTVALLVFFFLTYGDHMRIRVATAYPTFRYRRIALRVVRGVQVEVSRYLLTVTVINCCLGLAAAGVLFALHMPDPFLWGGLVALLNFMPYIGAITNTLLLLVVGFLHFHTALDAVLPALCFAVLAALEGNLVTPLVLGRRMRLSPVAILVWLLIWAWLWGIPGALLAVPMLTVLKVVTEWMPGWQWFARMVEH
ncbi:MAG TPA: AI-2E family transporter [Rhodanobacteraceae bacterium]